MYLNAAILAAVVLVYSAMAGRVARSRLSGPILFTGAGLMLGPLGLDVLRIDIAATDLKVIAEAALAMVLFTDAAHADLRVVRRNVGLPQRLLLIGLPHFVGPDLGAVDLGGVSRRGQCPVDSPEDEHQADAAQHHSGQPTLQFIVYRLQHDPTLSYPLARPNGSRYS